MKKLISILFAVLILVSSSVFVNLTVFAEDNTEQGNTELVVDKELNGTYKRINLKNDDMVYFYITSYEYKTGDIEVTVNDKEVQYYETNSYKDTDETYLYVYQIQVKRTDNVKCVVHTGSLTYDNRFEWNFSDEDYYDYWYGCKVYSDRAICDIVMQTDKEHTIDSHFYIGEQEITDVTFTKVEYEAVQFRYTFTVGLKDKVKVTANISEKPTQEETETQSESTQVTEPVTTETTQPTTEPTQATKAPTTEPGATTEIPVIKSSTKKSNPIKVSAVTKKIKSAKLKSKKQTIKSILIKNAQGKVTVKLVKQGTSGKIYKKLKISNKGVITLKKGKYNKGTYKVRVKISASGNSKYKSKAITKTIIIKVK